VSPKESHFFKPEKSIIDQMQTETMTEDYDIGNIPYRKSIVEKKYDNPVYRDRAHTSSKDAPPLPERKHEDLIQKVEQNKLEEFTSGSWIAISGIGIRPCPFCTLSYS